MPIAEDHVIWVMPSGERRTGRIAICAPEPDPDRGADNDTTWACWFSLDGIDKPRRIFGAGSFQPLMLALQMIGYQIHEFVSHGGKVLDPDEGGPALLSLRVLLRKPDAPYPLDPDLAELDAELAEEQRRYKEEHGES